MGWGSRKLKDTDSLNIHGMVGMRKKKMRSGNKKEKLEEETEGEEGSR